MKVTVPVDYRALIDEVYTRLDLAKVYTDPAHKFQKSDEKWRGGCPFHKSKSETSFVVSPKEPARVWYCAGCQVGGDPLDYLHRISGGRGSPRGTRFVELLKELCELTGVPFPEREPTSEDEKRHARQAVLTTVALVCQRVLWSPSGAAARDWAHSRGFTDDDLVNLGVGLHPDVATVRDALRAAGQDLDFAREAGVLGGHLVGYTVWPWHDDRGAMLTLYGKWPAKNPPDGKPKTTALPNPKTDGTAWEATKHSPQYLDRARRAGHRRLVVVEGVTDAALAQVRGETNVVACVGASLSKGQVETLKRCRVEGVTIALDPDKAGENGVGSCVNSLTAAGIPVYVAPKLHDGMDPDEFILRRGVEAWRAHVEAARHGFAWKAAQILDAHKPPGGWTDERREDAVCEAVQWAAERVPADRDDELARHFVPVLVQAAGGDPGALRNRIEAERRRQTHKGNGDTTAEEPPPGEEDEKPRWPVPKKASEVSRDAPPLDYVLHGMIAAGHLSLLSALMKCGKSTLLALLLRALESGATFLGRQSRISNVLYVSEESETIWADRIGEVGIADHVSFILAPFMAKPSLADWTSFVNHLLACHKATPFDLVVFDTLSNLWPVADENAAADVTAALMPLRALTRTGLAVLGVHHVGKTEVNQGKGARGSSALAGFVDALFEMRRFRPDDHQDRRRVLTGWGRFRDVPDELVIELAEDGRSYAVEGGAHQARLKDVAKTLLRILPTVSPGWSYKDIAANWPGERSPRHADLVSVLNAGLHKQFRSGGDGKKNDPKRFWRVEL